MSKYDPFTGHRKAADGRNFKRYCVWNKKTETLIAACATAKECAKAMNVSLSYFHAIPYFQSIGRCRKWDIESYFEDDPDDDPND